MAERGRAGLALRLALLAVLAFAGWRVLGLGLADHWADSDPERALAWRADHPEALRNAAEAAFDAGQPDRAEDFARRALQANPLDGRAYRVLARVAEARGDTARALALFTEAAARSPRDLPSQLWLADHHLKRAELAPALARLDVVLRVQPSALRSLLPTFLSLAASPRAHKALVERLGTNPPWRQGVMGGVVRQTELAALGPLMDRLRAAGPLPERELHDWLDRLVRDGRWGQAYLTWASQLGPDGQAALGNVFDGGFELPPEGRGFGWRFDPVNGARADRLAQAGASGQRALRVAFQDRRVPFRHVRQQLALPPGRYRFSGRARPDQLRTERGLVWTLACAPGRPVLGETEPLRGNGPWREFSLEFEVPAGGCGGQWLTLRLPARIQAEQRIGGRAWFDDLKIIRLP